MKPVAYISKNGVLFKELPPEGMDLIPLYATPSDLTNEESESVFQYLISYFDSIEGKKHLDRQFESLSGEEKLAILNRTMDLMMAKTGQVIDSLEVQ